ncbi:DUF3195 domain-containing protein [Pyrobaculum aerophilum]|uniref:Uncharacterized protein n=2 Tax=Pyrobaculum aerophilum TaxID=13773 RepID=Q8ZYK2_PYRAE|nr:hypothetical protein PAE0736 [Pyrobaculum aerophilum str. IM2]RFA97416.1 hypothetical protein CGL51_02925 [Pyrobaculum aerophilum]RFA97477.1 hypothetical protein CGL52_09110 [Pyrobaculum aerophilum]HII48237.1 DUF3195 domain-containing protein [Pyrobaculum aerophilum]
MKKHIIIKTIPKKEEIISRDLCDCIYYYDNSVICKPIGPSKVYVSTSLENLEKCLQLHYFKKLVKNIEIFDEVHNSKPNCDKCLIVEIGGVYFVRRVN